MKQLLLIALALAALAAPRAHAGPILDPSSYIMSYNLGQVYDQNGSYLGGYTDEPQQSQGTSPTVSSSSTQSYTSPSGDVTITGNTSGTASATPSPTSFSSFQFTASALTTATNTGSGVTNQQTDTFYSGTFTLDKTYNYKLNISGTQSSSSTATSSNDAAYSTGYLIDNSTSSYVGNYAAYSRYNGTDSSNSPVSSSGTLGPGTYTIWGDAQVEHYSAANTTDNATISYSLQLSPAATPEPASLTLLGLGAVSLAGYGWRRRKQTATA
jgi:hypothetical protein